MLVPAQSLNFEQKMMQQRDRQRKRTEQVANSKLSGFLGIIDSWSHRKIGSMAIAKRNPLAGQPCRTPLATRNCPRSAPANSTCVMLSPINTSLEAAEKIRQASVLKHTEDPGVIDAGISSSKIWPKIPGSLEKGTESPSFPHTFQRHTKFRLAKSRVFLQSNKLRQIRFDQ